MVLIEDIYLGAARLINDLIRTEFKAQGHTLTGAFEDSLTYEVTKTKNIAKLVGKGLSYGMLVNDGYTPSQISDKMFPGLMAYFIKRGLDAANAKQAAGATIKKWKNEGMSTQASKRFSATGGRQHFVEAAFTGNEAIIDGYIGNLFDFAIEEQYNRTKSETI